MQYTSRQATLIGYSVTAIILSSTLVILRLVSRRLSAVKVWCDDTLIILALVSLMVRKSLPLIRLLTQSQADLLCELHWELVKYFIALFAHVPLSHF